MRKSDLPDGYFSSQVLLNSLVFRQFSRIKCTAFRGESSSSGHNMASSRRGVFTQPLIVLMPRSLALLER